MQTQKREREAVTLESDPSDIKKQKVDIDTRSKKIDAMAEASEVEHVSATDGQSSEAVVQTPQQQHSEPHSTCLLVPSERLERHLDTKERRHNAHKTDAPGSTTGIATTDANLESLAPREWLSDDPINSLLTLLSSSGGTQLPSFTAVSSFHTMGRSDLHPHWYIVKKVSQYPDQPLFLPINKSSHWVLAIIHPLRHEVELFDPYACELTEQIERHAKNVMHDFTRFYFPDTPSEEWTLLPVAGPIQTNGFDCGCLMLITAVYLVAQQRIPKSPASSLWRLIIHHLVKVSKDEMLPEVSRLGLQLRFEAELATNLSSDINNAANDEQGLARLESFFSQDGVITAEDAIMGYQREKIKHLEHLLTRKAEIIDAIRPLAETTKPLRQIASSIIAQEDLDIADQILHGDAQSMIHNRLCEVEDRITDCKKKIGCITPFNRMKDPECDEKIVEIVDNLNLRFQGLRQSLSALKLLSAMIAVMEAAEGAMAQQRGVLEALEADKASMERWFSAFESLA